jgi:hypothetical protein
MTKSKEIRRKLMNAMVYEKYGSPSEVLELLTATLFDRQLVGLNDERIRTTEKRPFRALVLDGQVQGLLGGVKKGINRSGLQGRARRV